jgi:hypothetical protein
LGIVHKSQPIFTFSHLFFWQQGGWSGHLLIDYSSSSTEKKTGLLEFAAGDASTRLFSGAFIAKLVSAGCPGTFQPAEIKHDNLAFCTLIA